MKPKNILIASAAAALFLSGAVAAQADDKAGANQVRCAGVNACKGQNGCKGEGVMMMSADDCKAKGGTVAPAKP